MASVCEIRQWVYRQWAPSPFAEDTVAFTSGFRAVKGSSLVEIPKHTSLTAERGRGYYRKATGTAR